MKTTVEVYDHDDIKYHSDGKELSGLEKVMEQYPFLTGSELKEILELKTKIEYLEKKNYLHERLEELSQHKDKWFKHKHKNNSNKNSEVYSRIDQYEIEWNDLYVNVTSFVISDNGIVKDETRYLVDRFLELEPKAISSQKYYTIRDQFDDLTSNFNRVGKLVKGNY